MFVPDDERGIALMLEFKSDEKSSGYLRFLGGSVGDKQSRFSLVCVPTRQHTAFHVKHVTLADVRCLKSSSK